MDRGALDVGRRPRLAACRALTQDPRGFWRPAPGGAGRRCVRLHVNLYGLADAPAQRQGAFEHRTL